MVLAEVEAGISATNMGTQSSIYSFEGCYFKNDVAYILSIFVAESIDFNDLRDDEYACPEK